ncbi:AAA family ATPase [Streptomyces longispororuber]|uniref:AAA family ATPase n=1 Tax=Streptomyces longispororuber TaxID=68230 RepID=UPI00210E4717|nr:LuxR family transcriptional regulator [Streptomyces longispororuber]MCQ4213796.1 AAA family ATPase [Streptomyces longispororuber]
MGEPTRPGGPRGASTADHRASRAQSPVGRDAECALLVGLLQSLSDRGAALLVLGDPGIGKSTLLDYVAGCARHRILRARGVESEAVLPYTVLADLLLPLRPYFAELPSIQRRALETCFALVEADEPNPYAVCAATLGVLAAAGETHPLVLLVDDLHWADPSSRRALQFVARRLATERVALVLAARPSPDDDVTWEGVPRLTLAPLDEGDCLRLLTRDGVDPAEPASTRLVRLSMGNPLVLVEYAKALVAAKESGDEVSETAWETPGPLVERAWWSRLRTLSPETRTALLYVAACHTPELGVLAQALAAEGMPLTALDEAEEAGLIHVRGAAYELRHPVLRALVFRRSSVAQRLHVYRTLADLSAGELRTWYLASATVGTDEKVAEALADAAARSRRRGALGAAAHAWRRAAELSPSAGARAQRLLNAARDAFYSGASRDAVDWCEQALRWSRDARLTADIELLRGQACGWLGEPARAHRALVAAAEAVEPVDRARACALYATATLPATMDGRMRAAVDTAARSAALADLIEKEAGGAPGVLPSRHLANVMHGCAQALAGGVQEGRRLLLAGRAGLHGDWPLEEQQFGVQIGQALSWVDERDAAMSVLDAVIDRARREGVPALLPYALIGRCEVTSWSRWQVARAAGTESLHWALELGHRAMAGYAQLLMARLDGLRGDRAGCEDRIADYERHCGHDLRGLELFAQAALGSAALTAGDPETARAHLVRALSIADEIGLDNPNLMPFLSELAEAHVRVGDPAAAAALADRLDQWARTTALVWPAAAHAHCRIMLAESADQVDVWFRTAEHLHARTEMVFERARTKLTCGTLLRRFRRPAAARGLLLDAQLAFAGLGAGTWQARAATELAAAGHRAVEARPTVPPIDRLTAQELQVALAIGDGLSNGEAAAALFVSRKTVEAHLTRVYRKLGVRSRSELAGYLVRADMVR